MAARGSAWPRLSTPLRSLRRRRSSFPLTRAACCARPGAREATGGVPPRAARRRGGDTRAGSNAEVGTDSAGARSGPGGSRGPREQRAAPSPLPPARLLRFSPSKLAGRDWPQRRRAAGPAASELRVLRAAESGPHLGRRLGAPRGRSLSVTTRLAAAYRHWGWRARCLCTWHAQGPPPNAPGSLQREDPPGTRPPGSGGWGGHSVLF